MKTKKIAIRVSPEFKKRIEEKAKKKGLSVSAYIHYLESKD